MNHDSMQALMDSTQHCRKQIVVLARQDHAEAMRVAAGLTIFGHDVYLVFVDRVVEESSENTEQAGLLELVEIEPVSLVEDSNIDRIDGDQLTRLLLKCQHVINI